jgi:hypothetical protein
MPTSWPAGFVDGVRRFNAGAFFEAHEAFEETLDAVEGDDRWELLVALIQVAVGYHKAANGLPGAAHMLALGAAKLAAFPDVAWGVAIAPLRRRAADDAVRIERGRPPGAPAATRPPRLELRAAGARP